MKTLSILGCGWLGRAVAAKFLNNGGWHVNGSTTRPEKCPELQNLSINPFTISLAPTPTGDNLATFFAADALLVAIPPKRKTGGSDFYLHQIKSLATHLAGTPVRRVIFVSSTSVYPELNREVFEADADPLSDLFKAEHALLESAPFKTTVLRFGGLIGPNRNPGNFLSGKTDLPGGDSPINMIHQHDCVNIIHTLVSNDVFGDVFNACADHHPTKKEFYTRASQAAGLPPPVFNGQAAPFKIVNSDKLKSRLGYEFTFGDLLDLY
ncbi:SDR family oxidoreductase [Chryseolinea lacunae]|uniref:SDR family oxidoreductase n=1 Tax=Chryseolinea lacunae TaxID=2801331 RepID=A0ABS1KKH9_9BACT|nr:SDR family oxidoreductase [Chryseolinea lacunae]MBL0739951.1 SDR family oxidoreductase [Chryseolinea lacunae]